MILRIISDGKKLYRYKDCEKYHQIIDLDQLSEEEFSLCLV